MRGYDIVRIGNRYEARFLFEADDCEAVAAMLPFGDGWFDDLMSAVDELRALEAER